MNENITSPTAAADVENDDGLGLGCGLGERI